VRIDTVSQPICTIRHYGLLKKFGFAALVSGFIKVATIPLSAVTFAGHK